MKKLAILGIVALVLAISLAVAVPAAAAPPTIVTVEWLEDGTRYNPDGTLFVVSWNPWTDDPNGPMDLRKTGKAYHVVDINQYYNPFGPATKEGYMVISGAGNLSGHATYTSGVSGLPIRDRFKGNVTIDPQNETMEGTYTQYSYAFGTEDEVKAYYPYAEAEDSPEPGEAGWWFIFYTEYTAHQ